MLIKGYLSKIKTSTELKKTGHDLNKLWDLFKKETSDDKLAEFDITINHLNEVELLRYPDKIVDDGYVLNVRLGAPVPMNMPGTENLPQYFVNVSDLDNIVINILRICKVAATLYFKNAPAPLMESLPHILRPAGD
jgi:hypothetical protein